ncbi:hypothetical protein ACHAXR_004287 [Thalassiosira sp. AJA248-18]
MLMPIIAAVGSFVVSERILKPKATALFVLACLAVFDVFVSPPIPPVHEHHDTPTNNATNSHKRFNNTELDEFWEYDSHHYSIEEDDLATSLRCYRGPALLAVTMFCAAYSLRIWRRNGVACDELLFLPDTPHEFRLIGGDQKSSHGIENSGVAGEIDNSTNNRGSGGENDAAEVVSPIKSCFSEGDAAAGTGRSPSLTPARAHSRTEDFDASSATETPFVERMPLMIESSGSSSAPTLSSSRLHLKGDDSPLVFIRDQALKGIDMLVIRKQLRPPPLNIEDNAAPGEPSSAQSSDNNEVYDAEYAPSGPSVLGAALDLSLPVLFNFHMFVVLMKNHYKKEVESEEEPSGDIADGKVDVSDDTWMKPPQLPPKVLPLFFITPLILRSMVPPRQRRRFFKTILQGAVFSPFKKVRFRDAFVADCATSMVRPIVDLVYALAYYCTAIFGLFSGRYDLNQADHLLSKSMLMHGLILPAISFLPLFVKFLQTIRQAYDTGKRWPYLGNAFKYFSAGLVILYGMTHAAEERSEWWIYSFVLATIYQIIWDSWMDWELLVIVPREPSRRRTSSLIANLCRKLREMWDQIRLRPKRLFDDDSFYWKALFLNATLRFCWMAGFFQAYRVSISDGSTQVTFVDKAHGWSFVLLATLEIFRRCIWGIIKVELETIKLTCEGENDLDMASTAEEYLREGKWKVPPHDPTNSSTFKSVVSRCRPNVLWFRHPIKPVRSTLEEEIQVVGLDSQQNQYSKLDQTEQSSLSLEISKDSLEKKTHRWFSSGFLRLLFMLELLLWPCLFLVLSYYIILIE